MKQGLTIFGKAALAVGLITIFLLFVMNTEVHLHPFSIHIYNPEKLTEVFVTLCAFTFLDLHGRMKGFEEGVRYVLDLIKEENEEREEKVTINNGSCPCYDSDGNQNRHFEKLTTESNGGTDV